MRYNLFTHAEVAEDVVESFLRSDGATGDVSKVGKNHTEVFCYEVTAKVCLHRSNYPRQVLMGMKQSLVVAH